MVDVTVDSNYLEKLERTINLISSNVTVAEEWCKDQKNGMTDGEICIAALKDVRRLVRGVKKWQLNTSK